MSNLACRFITRGTTKEIQNLFEGVGKRLRDLLLKFFYPLHISGTVEARNFKFGASKQSANIRDDQ